MESLAENQTISNKNSNKNKKKDNNNNEVTKKKGKKKKRAVEKRARRYSKEGRFEVTEKKFRKLLNTTNGKAPLSKGVTGAISMSVMKDLQLKTIFPDLTEHMRETDVTDNHFFNLIKSVCKNYCKIRMFHIGKQITNKISQDKIKKKYSKLILFKSQ